MAKKDYRHAPHPKHGKSHQRRRHARIPEHLQPSNTRPRVGNRPIAKRSNMNTGTRRGHTPVRTRVYRRRRSYPLSKNNGRYKQRRGEPTFPWMSYSRASQKSFQNFRRWWRKFLRSPKHACMCILALILAIVVVVAATVLALILPGLNTSSTSSGDAGNGNFDHRSHAVAGSTYTSIDFDNDGSAVVRLDGSRSHSHYFDPGSPEVTGRIVTFSWFLTQDHTIFAETATPMVRFPVGQTEIGLRVVDNTNDMHTDFATVTVLEPIAPGAYCYYYEARTPNTTNFDEDAFAGIPQTLPNTGDRGRSVRPVHAQERPGGIDFEGRSDFVKPFRSTPFRLHCFFQLPANGQRTEARVTHEGGPVKLLVRDSEVFRDNARSGAHDISFEVPSDHESPVSCQLLFERLAGGATPISLSVRGIDSMEYDLAQVVPVLLAVDPTSSTLPGGGRVKLVGVGLFNDLSANFGQQNIPVVASTIDGESVLANIPSAEREGVVPVTLSNQAGQSNSIDFTFSRTGLPPLILDSQVVPFPTFPRGVRGPSVISGIAYGPDHRWYMSSLDGHVYSFDLSRDMTIESVCKSESLGANRTVLSVAFNPAERTPRVYVATAILEWKLDRKIESPDGWQNGKIFSLVPRYPDGTSDACLTIEKEVIGGLPVSNHDHGISALVFDQDGRLHFQAGGFTNAGYNTQGNKLGGLDETPLSAASLVAPVMDQTFDGIVTYSSADPATARQTGGDVRVYSPGWRNSFGMCYHSTAGLLATDNGANMGFGDVSKSCNKHTPLDDHRPDELTRVIEGKYAGHPNRNRGRDDPRECEMRDLSSPSDEYYEAPIATFESSTDGVMEYTSNVLGGQLKNNVLASKYSTNDSPGRLYRVRLDNDGSLKPGGLDSLWEASGLSLAMSPWGDILMPRVYRQELVVLRPRYSVGNSPEFLSVMPFRGPASGRNVVLVTGHNLGGDPVAFFGDSPCTDVVDIAPDGGSFKCKVPEGHPGASVQVSVRGNDGRIGKSHGGIDYMYMNI